MLKSRKTLGVGYKIMFVHDGIDLVGIVENFLPGQFIAVKAGNDHYEIKENQITFFKEIDDGIREGMDPYYHIVKNPELN